MGRDDTEYTQPNTVSFVTLIDVVVQGATILLLKARKRGCQDCKRHGFGGASTQAMAAERSLRQAFLA